jgi:hypothetical protein
VACLVDVSAAFNPNQLLNRGVVDHQQLGWSCSKEIEETSCNVFHDMLKECADLFAVKETDEDGEHNFALVLL